MNCGTRQKSSKALFCNSSISSQVSVCDVKNTGGANCSKMFVGDLAGGKLVSFALCIDLCAAIGTYTRINNTHTCINTLITYKRYTRQISGECGYQFHVFKFPCSLLCIKNEISKSVYILMILFSHL